MSSKCPKCGKKLSAFYLKQNCPDCGVNLMYYKHDEMLEQDAKKAAAEVEKVENFKALLKNSAVKTPLHIVRLVLFFTPLLSMCLPMYYAGHKKVSLIAFILSIVNHGIGIGVWSSDYLFAVLAMVCVILFSLAVIINSLFSATENGGLRNLVFSLINTAVFGALSVLVCANGGEIRIGFYVTMAIYALESVLHLLTDKKKKRSLKGGVIMSVLLCAVIAAGCVMMPKDVREPLFDDGGYYDENRVVSFNLAAPWGTPFDDTAGKDRKERFVNYMRYEDPALIGTQELNSEWLDYINKNMPEYESYAVKRGGDGDENTSEMNGIFWVKDIYEAVDTDTFWLSQTPDRESRFTYTDENGEKKEAGCNRICSYAILKNRNSGRLIAFMNTHLDNSSEEAVSFGAKLIVEKTAEIKAQYKDIDVILTGDFNSTSDSDAYKIITSVLNDTTKGECATWQDWGYTDTGDKPIDFIFTSKKGKSYEVLNNLTEGYVSDHYGIMAETE